MSLYFEPEAHIRDFIGFRRREAERELANLLPDAKLEHVGSTAIPSAWTNGNVDIQVRVPAGAFKDAEKALAGKYTRVEIPGKNDGYAVFRHDGRGIHLHLTAMESTRDVMVMQRELLKSHALLRERYDAIKRRHQNGDPESYRKAKEEFWTKQAG